MNQDNKAADTIDTLGRELNELSFCIRELKGRMLKATGKPEYWVLKKEFRQLQWQALFYIQKIENLREQAND